MLGILNDPPTSTSSPLETMASLSFANVDKTKSTAAALLFTIKTSSAFVSFFIVSV